MFSVSLEGSSYRESVESILQAAIAPLKTAITLRMSRMQLSEGYLIFFSHQMIEEPETRSRASYYVADSHGAVYPIVRSVSGLKSKNILKPSFLKRICGLPSHITKDTLGIALNNFCRVLFPLAFLLFNLIYWLVIAT